MFIYALKKIGIFLALLVGLLVLRFCGDVLERVNDRSIGMSSLLGQAQAQPLDPGTAKWADLGTWQVYGSTRTRNCTMIARYDTMHMAVTFSQQDAALVFLNVPATKVDVGNTTHHFIAMMGGEANGQSGGLRSDHSQEGDRGVSQPQSGHAASPRHS